MRILYNSINHDVVCTDQDVEYTNHDVVYIFHGDNLEIDEIVIIFVYSKKNVFYLKIRTIVLITIVDYPLDLRAGHKKRETVEYQPFPFVQVGVPRFELGTPCSQSRCANRTALHPVLQFIVFISDCGAKVRLYFKLQNFSVTFFMKNIIFLLSG